MHLEIPIRVPPEILLWEFLRKLLLEFCRNSYGNSSISSANSSEICKRIHPDIPPRNLQRTFLRETSRNSFRDHSRKLPRESSKNSFREYSRNLLRDFPRISTENHSKILAWITQAIYSGILQDIASEHPQGILSVITLEISALVT